MTDQQPQQKFTQRPRPLIPLEEFDTRLAHTESSEEIILLTQVRGELIRQNSQALDRETRRFLQRWGAISRTLLSAAGLGVGTLLVFNDYTVAGLFVLGAGLYSIAPEFTMKFFHRRHDSEANNDG